MDRYFETLVVPCIKKVCSATLWKWGKAKDHRGSGIFIRVQELEQYEGTLETLAIDSPKSQDVMGFDDLAFSIQYRLDHRQPSGWSAGMQRCSPPGAVA